LKQNRKEIEEALLVLAPQSDEQHRKLDYSINPPVISFELGTDMVSFFNCYCDKSNAGNDGCSKKSLVFAEAVVKAVTQKANIIGENPDELLFKVREIYDGHSTCKRQSLFSLC
jgi:hypothetical protein